MTFIYLIQKLIYIFPTTFVERANTTSIPTTVAGRHISTKIVGKVYFDKSSGWFPHPPPYWAALFCIPPVPLLKPPLVFKSSLIHNIIPTKTTVSAQTQSNEHLQVKCLISSTENRKTVHYWCHCPVVGWKLSEYLVLGYL